MCNSIYLATDSQKDLTVYNEELICFKQQIEDDKNSVILKNKLKWYISSSNGCSCSFRHLLPENVSELGFGEPEDWFPEEKENIDATKKLYRVIRELVEEKYKVEILDIWLETDLKEIKNKKIKIKEITEEEFRLFENYIFEII